MTDDSRSEHDEPTLAEQQWWDNYNSKPTPPAPPLLAPSLVKPILSEFHLPCVTCGKRGGTDPSPAELLALAAYVSTGTQLEAAHLLSITIWTVEKHLRHAYAKSGCTAAQLAYRLGRGDFGPLPTLPAPKVALG